MADERRRARLRIYVMLAVLTLLALTAAWHWTPLREYADPRLIARTLGWMAHSAWMPMLILALYVLSNAIMFPNTVLCLATILALGTHPGLLYATVGSLLAALSAYAGGRVYGADLLPRLQIKGLARAGETLRQGGIIQMTLLRLLPLAPFSVVNLLAGALRVRVLPFTIGTLLGMLPGNLLFTVFGRQLRQLIAHPTPVEVAATASIILVTSAVFWYLHRLTMARTAPAD